MPDSGAFDITVAMKSILRMRVNLADNLQFKVRRELNTRNHRRRWNVEAALRGPRFRPEDGGSQGDQSIGASEEIDDALVTLRDFGRKSCSDGFKAVFRKDQLRIGRQTAALRPFQSEESRNRFEHRSPHSAAKGIGLQLGINAQRHSAQSLACACFFVCAPVGELPLAMRATRIDAGVGKPIPGCADHGVTVEKSSAFRRVLELIPGFRVRVIPVPGRRNRAVAVANSPEMKPGLILGLHREREVLLIDERENPAEEKRVLLQSFALLLDQKAGRCTQFKHQSRWRPG